MTAVIPVLAKAAVFGVVLGAGSVSMLPEGREQARIPVFLIATVASVALTAIAWYFGVPTAVFAFGGMVLNAYSQDLLNTTDVNKIYQKLAGGILFGAAVGYLLDLGVCEFDRLSNG